MTRTACILLTVVALVLIVWPETASAQCAMCRAAAENSLREGGTQAAGLNKGILYLAMFPYAAVAFMGFLAWRHWRRKRLAEAA
jgi:hypothetical protein